MLSSVISPPLELADDAAAREHQHAVAKARQLHRVRGIDTQATPLIRLGANGAIDIEARVGVDALGGLVDQQRFGAEEKLRASTAFC